MSRGIQKYRCSEVKRAVRALQEAGVKIARVAFEDGKFEIVTADDRAPGKPTAVEEATAK